MRSYSVHWVPDDPEALQKLLWQFSDGTRDRDAGVVSVTWQPERVTSNRPVAAGYTVVLEYRDALMT